MMGEMSVIADVLLPVTPRESGGPGATADLFGPWIPAFAGTTINLTIDFAASRRRIELALVHRDLLCHRSQRDGGKEGEAADDQHNAHQEADKERPVRRKGARGRSEEFLLRQRPGDGQ